MTAYDALHDSAAWLEISPRGRLRASGEDHLRLLHAICSNDVEGLRPGQGTEALFLNDRGHTQAAAHLWRAGDHLLIDTDPERREKLRQLIESYIIMDDVTLEDVTHDTAAFALEGPGASELAAALPPAAPPAELHAHVRRNGVFMARESLAGAGGVWYIVPRNKREEWRELLAGCGAVAASEADFELLRIEHGIPRLGEDYQETHLPQETQLMHVVSFQKGCYPGQEILERIRARGQVQRRLVTLELDLPEPPASLEVTVGGKIAGTMTSAVYSPRRGKVLGFAVVRQKALEEGAPVTVGGVAAKAGSLGAGQNS